MLQFAVRFAWQSVANDAYTSCGRLILGGEQKPALGSVGPSISVTDDVTKSSNLYVLIPPSRITLGTSSEKGIPQGWQHPSPLPMRSSWIGGHGTEP